MAIVVAGDFRPARHRHRARTSPRPAATATRAGRAGRSGCRARSPSAPATWPRCWAAPWRSICCFHIPLVLGRADHCLRRAAAAGAAAVRHAADRGRSSLCSSPPSPSAISSRSSCCRRRMPDLPGDGPGPGRAWTSDDPGMVYVAIGIIGATVMPHNLYLHSALVQSREAPDRRQRRSRRVPSASTRSTPRWRCRSPSSSTPPSWCWPRTCSTARTASRCRAARWSRSTTTPTGSTSPTSRWRRCSAPSRRARCSPSRCWPAARAARSPARWPDRS